MMMNKKNIYKYLLIGLFLIVFGQIIKMVSMGISFLCNFISFMGLGIGIFALLFYPMTNKFLGKFVYALRILLMIGIAFFVLSFLFVEYKIISYADGEEINCQYIVVLGAGLQGDRPSLILQSRLEKALAYLKGNPHAKAILSGGQGVGETISEAEAMFAYLSKMGINENRLFLEDKSTSTKENLAFSLSILKSANNGVLPEKIGVLSNDFHLYRAIYYAESLGMTVSGLSAPLPRLAFFHINYYLREYFAVMMLYWQDIWAMIGIF